MSSAHSMVTAEHLTQGGRSLENVRGLCMQSPPHGVSSQAERMTQSVSGMLLSPLQHSGVPTTTALLRGVLTGHAHRPIVYEEMKADVEKA